MAAWELSNEPYLYPSFFPTGTAYLDMMKPFHRAIKAVNPDAIVSIFVTDQAKDAAVLDPWNLAIASYPDKYWDAISFHHYPSQSGGDFAQWMKEECAVLATRTSSIVTERPLDRSILRQVLEHRIRSLYTKRTLGGTIHYRRHSVGRNLFGRVHHAHVH